MDHTVYERKNTDLGSTSMTKSGGFSIKKRHRKLGALIGLAALAVPFAVNLGTLETRFMRSLDRRTCMRASC